LERDFLRTIETEILPFPETVGVWLHSIKRAEYLYHTRKIAITSYAPFKIMLIAYKAHQYCLGALKIIFNKGLKT
jgi:hypothetical protein